MNKDSVHKAAIPNPLLQPFAVLVGEWKTVGEHPLVPNTMLHGHSSFKWIEGGAFLTWYSEINKAGFPAGIAIFGSDDDEQIKQAQLYIEAHSEERIFIDDLCRKFSITRRNFDRMFLKATGISPLEYI